MHYDRIVEENKKKKRRKKRQLYTKMSFSSIDRGLWLRNKYKGVLKRKKRKRRGQKRATFTNGVYFLSHRKRLKDQTCTAG